MLSSIVVGEKTFKALVDGQDTVACHCRITTLEEAMKDFKALSGRIKDGTITVYLDTDKELTLLTTAYHKLVAETMVEGNMYYFCCPTISLRCYNTRVNQVSCIPSIWEEKGIKAKLSKIKLPDIDNIKNKVKRLWTTHKVKDGFELK